MPRKKCLKNQGITAKLGWKSMVVLGEESALVGETSAVDAAPLYMGIHPASPLCGKSCPTAAGAL